MRPRTLEEFIGQEHIVGPGRLLRRAIQKDALSSLILSGPPGSGKTTLARVIAGSTARRFVTLNAVLDGVQAVRNAVEDARSNLELYGRRTILFVDEVHRWNKSQQDALLPWVENGTIVLIGATTENPFFEVNRALVSRSRVFLLQALGEADLVKVANQTLGDRERGYGAWKVLFEDGALEHLVAIADGDARNLLNALELAVETETEAWPPPEGAEIRVSKHACEESIQRRAVLYDKDGDYHYDCISAFIKSLRGSDPDAALYWLARMVYSGEDPSLIIRRMLVSAAEDVGLADPQAVAVVDSCARAFERIGMPEGQFHLAQAALYLATAPKSNSSLGFFDALASVGEERADVSDRLKDGSRDAAGFGHGEGYKYPHAYRDHWVAQAYLPENLKGRVFYRPGSMGHEGHVRDAVLVRREAQLLAPDDDSAPAAWTWSASANRSREWLERAEGERANALLAVRVSLFEKAAPARHDRVLVLGRFTSLFAWEALRRCPDGTVVATVASDGEAALIDRYSDSLPEIERPVSVRIGSGDAVPAVAESVKAAAGFAVFDLVLGMDVLPRSGDTHTAVSALAASFPGARFVLAERAPSEGSTLSEVLSPAFADRTMAERFRAFERGFFLDASPDRPDPHDKACGSSHAPEDLRFMKETRTTERRISEMELRSWFSDGNSYGRALVGHFGAEAADTLLTACIEAARRPVTWKSTFTYVLFRAPGTDPRA